jgi:subtilisin-like proprotein convertase family protein
MRTRVPGGWAALALVMALAFTGQASADTISFSNPTPITIPGAGTGTPAGAPANPYPSSIVVSDVTGATGLTVSLFGLSHTFPTDIDILLVSPTGGRGLLLSDVGGGTDIVDVALTFQDGAPGLPAVIVSGTYSPTNLETGDLFLAPAPAGPYGSPPLADLLGGDVNGTWNLFIVDDTFSDVGALSGGWRLTFEVAPSSVVPEPGSLTLLGFGVAGLVVYARRRHKQVA